MKKLLFLSLLLIGVSFNALAQQGAITGTILDEKSGETLIGANVLIENTTIGTATDFDGKYQFKADPGVYTIHVSYIGYIDKKIQEVEIKAGETTFLDVMISDEALELDLEIVVKAKVIERSENAVLMLQKRSDKIQDGISSQEISRLGVSSAAGALQKVTGTTVVDGKYIFVRGLGDRYSSTSINGIRLPSIDPYRNSAQLDLVPSNLLDNIIASKTFTPDLPGDFTGGSINIKTKSLPERFTYNVSLSTSYNSQNHLRDDFLTFDAGDQAFLGFNDGTLDRPSLLDREDIQGVLNRNAALQANLLNKDEPALLMDEAARSFNQQFVPSVKNSFLDYNISASLGNQFSLGGKPLGVLVTMNYSRNFTQYQNGVQAIYINEGTGVPTLDENVNMADNLSVETPQLGGLAGLTFKPSPNNELSFLTIYSHSTDISSRELSGRFRTITAPRIFESRGLGFQEREFIDYILSGSHLLSGLKNVKIEWTASVVDSKQDEPDLRFFANTFREDRNTYTVDQSNYSLPGHFFRVLDDRLMQGKLDITIPFAQSASPSNKFKFGGYFSRKERDFTESIYNLDRTNSGGEDYAGDPAKYFGNGNIGLIQEEGDDNIMGLYIVDNSRDDNNYVGETEIAAGYGMFTLQLLPKVKFIGGARVETTDIFVESKSEKSAKIDEVDILPAANIIYEVGENANIRASYSNTLARPNMREVAPFANFGFIGDPELFGNPDLVRTRINNMDLRYEYFMRPGEIFAVSAFYKLFKDPIVQTFRLAGENPQFTFQNSNNATLYGAEIEIRKSLDFISPSLQNMSVSGNFAYIYSESDIDSLELQVNREVDPSFSSTRPLVGQSEFVANFNLNYVDQETGLDAILAYNFFSDRLASAGVNGSPDIFEQGRSQLDFSISKRFGEQKRLKVSLRARNLINPEYKTFAEFVGQEYTYTRYKRGREFSFGIGYTL